MGRVLSMIAGATLLLVALGATAWRVGVAVTGEGAQATAQTQAPADAYVVLDPRVFSGALRALPADAPDDVPAPPPAGGPEPMEALAATPTSPEQPESALAPAAPDTPLARLGADEAQILAVAPPVQRPPSPFDTLEPLLPPIRPHFDELAEKIAPLPPRRPNGLDVAAITKEDAAAAVAKLAPPAVAPLAPPQSLLALAPTLAPQAATPPAVSVAPQALPPNISVPQGAPGSGQIGSPVFVRIFKKEGALELYVRQNGRYALKKSFQVCKMSGRVGPKLKTGDYQAPEGFYSVTARQLNPNSQYHLAFNVGYPNAYDRQNGRTGSAIMVHGDCVSIGCFAMTNKGIEEIYGYVAAAIRNGQREVPVHIFPFRMSDSAIARETTGGGIASLFTRDSEPTGATSQWGDFWRDLKKGYDLFERTGEPPLAYACKGRYAFSPGAGCQRIAGW